MFKKAKFIVGVNSALADLGINTQSINPAFRQAMQNDGFESGLSERETAVVIACQLPNQARSILFEITVQGWTAMGAIRGEEISKHLNNVEDAVLAELSKVLATELKARSNR